MMTFEGAQCRGVAQITTKLAVSFIKCLSVAVNGYCIRNCFVSVLAAYILL